MKYMELKQISKLYFGYEEIARVLDINPESARVSAGTCSVKCCSSTLPAFECQVYDGDY